MPQQQINIIYLLLGHFNRYFWFEIPGIGIFNGRKSSTYIDHIEQKIYPANLIIDFVTSNTLRTEIMIQNMVAETGYEQELLEEHLAALCQTISESLKDDNFYEFLPFGIFKRDNENFKFNQSHTNIHQEFYWMEPLTIVPLVIPHVETTMPVALLPIQQTKSKKEFTFLLLALGILWLIFLGLLFCPPSSRNHTKENLPQLLDTIGTKATVDSIKIPQVAIQTQDAAQHFIKDTLKVTSDSLDKLKNESVIDSVNVNRLNEQINNKPCIIIIGSFIKTSYAARLSMKVKENGYEVYRGEYGKYHRVGIQFNCFEQDLKEMLKELKKKFHPDAWVLKY